MIEKIKEYDPNFTESEFLTFIDNVFIQVHLAITTKEINKIRHFVTEEVFKKIIDKISNLATRHLIEMYDEINVKHSKITNVEITDTEIVVKVTLTSRYMNYLLDEDGNYVSGNNKSRMEKDNYLKFTKKLDAKDLGMIRKCPTCGNSLDINNSGFCNYCHSHYDLENHGWVLAQLEV